MYINQIYEFIKGIVSRHEGNSDDEFEVLDKIFPRIPF